MAQTQNIGGAVVDESGAVIPGATVQIQDAAKGGTAKQVTTDDAGRFQVLGIEPGRYTISVEKTGFKKVEVAVVVDVNAKLDVGAIKLPVGTMTEAVSVSADVTPVITSNTMDKAYVVENTQMSELPMNGRNYTSLMNTVPGMTSAARSDFDVNFNDVSEYHSLGGRGSQNNFYLDGAPNIDVGDNQSQYTQASVDAVAEFRVLQSGFNAEYGRNSGVVVAVQTKSGGSTFHGTAYEYFRNNWLDAKCVLCGSLHPQLRYNMPGGNVSGWLPIPKISTKQDKRVFFFYNAEVTHRSLPSSTYADIPNATILSGDFRPWLLSTNMQYAPQFKNGTVFEPGTVTRDGAGNITGGTPFPNNIVPQSTWNSMSSALLKVYTGIPGYATLPAAPNAGYARNYYNNTDMLIKHQNLARVDYAVNKWINTFVRWVDDYQRESLATGIWTGEPFPIQPQKRPKPGSSWSFNLITTFTPNLVSETILTYNHQSQSLSVIGNNPLNRDTLGANWKQIYPQTNITNSVQDVTTGSGFGWGLGDPGWHNWGKDYGATENLSWIKGTHTLKFGAFYNRDNKAQTGNWGLEGSIDFSPSSSMPLDTGNGLANLMLGNFNNYSQQSAHVFPYFRFWEVDGYVQDSWKVFKRFTLEYGVRISHMTPTYTVNRGGTPGNEGSWNLYSVNLNNLTYASAQLPTINLKNGFIVGNPLQVLGPLGLVCDPCQGTYPGFSPEKTFVQPRVGFAYDVFGDGKTAVRSGFGMFNERLRQNNFSFGAGAQWPNLYSGTVYEGNVNSIDTSNLGSASSPIQPPNMTIWPRDNTMPTIYAWYFGVQHQLPQQFTVDISYSGSHSVHLMDQRQVNALPAGYLQNNDLSKSVNYWNNALLPYLGWGSLNAIETLSYARYDAMMLRFSRRFSKGLSLNFNYTYSEVTDIADNDSDQIINPLCIKCQHGPASYDQPNVIQVDWVYMLPSFNVKSSILRQVVHGWEISGMFRSQSGMPFTVTSNGNLFGMNLGSQYVDIVGDPYAHNNKFQWIDPNAFRRPPDGNWGNESRNALRQEGVRNLDMALMKSFSFSELKVPKFMDGVKITLRAEAFNLFNHPQAFGINTGFVGDNPGAGISPNVHNLGQINSYRDARTLQLVGRVSF